MKKFLPDLIAILAFIILSFAYFFPADIEGRILFQHDSVAGVGAGQESKEYLERTGERTRWTNSIFGGMPTYQMSPSYDSTKTLKWVEKVYQLGAGEILLTSMDCDGTKAGYDIELTRQIAENVSIPVIASGGAGTKEHFYEALTDGKADAALAASLFHYKELEIMDLKNYLADKGIPVRR